MNTMQRTHRLLSGAIILALMAGLGVSMNTPNIAHGATDYYVSATGSGAICSQASPCATITAALAKAVTDVEPNPTIYVSGTITDNVVIEDRVAIPRPIDWVTVTIIGESAKTTTIDGNASGTVLAALSDDPSSSNLSVSIRNIKLTNGSGYPINVPLRCGGGLFVETAYVTLDHVDITSNTVTPTGSYGGGICNSGGEILITKSAIRTNSAPIAGGIMNTTYAPVEHIYPGVMTLSNVTISGNVATNENASGGIYNHAVAEAVGSISMTNVTIVRNTNNNIANIGTILAFNSIIANPTSGANCYAHQDSIAVTSEGYNIEDDNTCITTSATGDKIGPTYTNPVNATLADNSGQTPTHALTTASPAYNSGNATSTGTLTAPTSDQRDLTRPARGGYDIGAYELQADPTPTPTATPTATPTPIVSTTVTVTVTTTATTIVTTLATTGESATRALFAFAVIALGIGLVTLSLRKTVPNKR